MNGTTISLILCVGFFNVLLNNFVRRIWTEAAEPQSFMEGIITWRFGFAFLIGCASLISLCALYFWIPGRNISKAILLTGAVSIVGGTLFFWMRGLVFPAYSAPLSLVEIGLLLLMAVFLVIRFSNVGQ